MDDFQNSFDHIREQAPALLLAIACIAKLRDKGFSIDGDTTLALSQSILIDGTTAALHFPDDDREIPTTIRAEIEETLPTLQKEDLKRALGIVRRSLRSTKRNLLAEAGDYFAREFEADRDRLVRELNTEAQGFRKRLARDWRRPFDTLTLMIWLCEDIGSSVNTAARAAATPSKIKLVDAITRLHARACQTAREVEALLHHGLSDGALARWRTLYELGVICAFIIKHGRRAAMLFIDHDIVGAKKRADDYNIAASNLGTPAFPAVEYRRIQRRCETVKRRYGKAFLTDYGWADVVLRRTNRMTFTELATLVDMHFLRDNYGAANENVHAPTLSLYERLGLHPTNSDVLLAGPSNLGLAAVCRLLATNLVGIAEIVVTLSASIDRIALLATARSMALQLFEESEAVEQSILERGAATARVLREPEDETLAYSNE